MLEIKKIFFLLFIAISIVSCSSVKTNIDDGILLGLSELKGEYVWHDALERYVFSKKTEIENLISKKDKFSTIHTLANCIDNTTISNSTLKDDKVKLGILCYEALSQTIYYEPILPNGDIALKWEGHIYPDASIENMKAAKRAWNDVITLKRQKFL